MPSLKKAVHQSKEKWKLEEMVLREFITRLPPLRIIELMVGIHGDDKFEADLKEFRMFQEIRERNARGDQGYVRVDQGEDND